MFHPYDDDDLLDRGQDDERPAYVDPLRYGSVRFAGNCRSRAALHDLPAVTSASVAAPPDTYGDESFGHVVALRSPLALAQLPRGLEYGWLQDLRVVEHLSVDEPLKWSHLARALATAPRGSIALGAAKTLSRALIVLLDLDRLREELGFGRGASDHSRFYEDAAVSDYLLATDPLVHVAGAGLEDMRVALGMPPPLPTPDNLTFLARAINGAFGHAERPERHLDHLLYAIRSPAVMADWMDPRTWDQESEHLRDARYGVMEKLEARVLHRALGPARSFEVGHEPPTRVLNALCAVAAPRPSFDNGYHRGPYPPIVEHQAKDFSEGQAADLAAGWAVSIYQGAGTHDRGLRELCSQFQGVIVNGELHQRS